MTPGHSSKPSAAARKKSTPPAPAVRPEPAAASSASPAPARKAPALAAPVPRSLQLPAGAPQAIRVLAIDPALRNTGWAIVERTGKVNRAIEWGVIRNKPDLLPSACLVRIRDELATVIRKHEPDTCAVEATIYVQNLRTAMTMGAARAAGIIAAAEAGLEISEYPPRRVKQAVVGRGAADKSQVAFMVRALLKLTETPPHDAADALAIGITHLEATDPLSLLKREASRV